MGTEIERQRCFQCYGFNFHHNKSSTEAKHTAALRHGAIRTNIVYLGSGPPLLSSMRPTSEQDGFHAPSAPRWQGGHHWLNR